MGCRVFLWARPDDNDADVALITAPTKNRSRNNLVDDDSDNSDNEAEEDEEAAMEEGKKTTLSAAVDPAAPELHVPQ